MCKNADIYICNGRLGNAAVCGINTCKDASVVDYVVVTPILMLSITKFLICEFNNILSDVYCAAVFSININFNVELLNEDDNAHDIDIQKTSTFIRWNNENVMSCKHNINLEDLCSLENQLDSLLESHDVENAKDNINSCVSKATNIIMSSANVSGIVKDSNVYKWRKWKKIIHVLITHVDNLEISILKQGMCIETHI